MNQLRRPLRLLPPLAFVGMLAVPAAQSVFHFAPARELSGVVAQPPPPAPRTLAGWHSGALQAEVEHALVQELGLRDWIVRLDNQLKLSLFGVTKAPVVRGPGDWLYEDGYLTARTHCSPERGIAILGDCMMVLQAQQVLKEHGITMLLLVSPSKVETVPMHLPWLHRHVQAQGFNRDIDVLQAILALGYIEHLDAQRLFWDWFAAEPDLPLFPRAGIHWSLIASARVIVRLLDQLERASGFDLVNLDIASTAMGSGDERGQNDLAKLINVLSIDGMISPLPVPVLSPRAGDHGQTAGILVVSSSFGWPIAEHLENQAAFRPLSVFYYFESRYDWIDGARQPSRPIDTDPAAFRAELLRYRFIVLECNTSQIRSLGFGFPKLVLAAFGQPEADLSPAVTAALSGFLASKSDRRAVR